MAKSITIPLRTLTPLWTGGVAGCDRLHETAVAGSLRWWYEALVRGLGGHACDPANGQARCVYDPDLGPASVCHACQVFGCPGLARAFRLSLAGWATAPVHLLTLMAGRGATQQPNNAWWLQKLLEGSGVPLDDLRCLISAPDKDARPITLALTPTRSLPAGVDLVSQVRFLLAFIAGNTALGRQSQNGFGQIQVAVDATDARRGLDDLRTWVRAPARRVETSPAWPSTRHLFSASFAVAADDAYLRHLLQRGQRLGREPGDLVPNHWIPCAFDLRYATRSGRAVTGLRWAVRKRDRQLAANLFGARGQASRIAVSHPHRPDGQGDYMVRVFGLVPEYLLTGSAFNDVESLVEFLERTLCHILTTTRRQHLRVGLETLQIAHADRRVHEVIHEG